MSTIHLKESTTSTPEQFVAALTDFGLGRSKIFGNSADGYLKVHDLSPHEADVTEGSAGIWERLHYDWSAPPRSPYDLRLKSVGRPLGTHLHLRSEGRRHDGRGRRRGA